MFGVPEAIAVWGIIIFQTGVIIGLCITAILAGSAALLGLGWGVRKVALSIFNYPEGWGYDPRQGSGMSRFQRGRRNARGGLNLMD